MAVIVTDESDTTRVTKGGRCKVGRVWGRWRAADEVLVFW